MAPGSPDREAFRKLVEANQIYAFRLAYRMLSNEPDARDVVQEAFIRVWRHWSSFDQEIKFTTWLYKIVVNLCYDQLKSRSNRRNRFDHEKGLDAIPGETDIERQFEKKELWRWIEQLAETLPPRQKLVFVLRDLQELSIEEVRQITGLSKAAIKTHLFHARTCLRRRLVE